jgi:hypothetical protein
MQRSNEEARSGEEKYDISSHMTNNMTMQKKYD